MTSCCSWVGPPPRRAGGERSGRRRRRRPLVSAIKVASADQEEDWQARSCRRCRRVHGGRGDPLAEKLSLLRRADAVLFPIDWHDPSGW